MRNYRRATLNQYFFVFLKIILIVFLLCFFTSFLKVFISLINSLHNFPLHYFILGLILPFLVNVFLFDQVPIYEKIQNFFFRNESLNIYISSLLIIVLCFYIIMPALINRPFSTNTFVLLGGYLFSLHLIFFAANRRNHHFIAFIDYLMLLIIIVSICLILLSVYLRINYSFSLGKIFSDIFQNSWELSKTMMRTIKLIF